MNSENSENIEKNVLEETSKELGNQKHIETTILESIENNKTSSESKYVKENKSLKINDGKIFENESTNESKHIKEENTNYGEGNEKNIKLLRIEEYFKKRYKPLYKLSEKSEKNSDIKKKEEYYYNLGNETYNREIEETKKNTSDEFKSYNKLIKQVNQKIYHIYKLKEKLIKLESIKYERLVKNGIKWKIKTVLNHVTILRIKDSKNRVKYTKKNSEQKKCITWKLFKRGDKREDIIKQINQWNRDVGNKYMVKMKLNEKEKSMLSINLLREHDESLILEIDLTVLK